MAENPLIELSNQRIDDLKSRLKFIANSNANAPKTIENALHKAQEFSTSLEAVEDAHQNFYKQLYSDAYIYPVELKHEAYNHFRKTVIDLVYVFRDEPF